MPGDLARIPQVPLQPRSSLHKKIIPEDRTHCRQNASTAAHELFNAVLGSRPGQRPGRDPRGGQDGRAQLPKSAGLRGVRCSSLDWEGDRDSLSLRVKLSADGISKGANETGIRRYRSFARHAERLGYTVRYIKNSVHGLTEDELNALVGGILKTYACDQPDQASYHVGAILGRDVPGGTETTEWDRYFCAEHVQARADISQTLRTQSEGWKVLEYGKTKLGGKLIMAKTNRRTKQAGVIAVHYDRRGDPRCFTDAAGNLVPCVCRPGLRCLHHVRMMQHPPTSDAAVIELRSGQDRFNTRRRVTAAERAELDMDLYEAMQYEEFDCDGNLIEPGDTVIELRDDGVPYTYTQPDLRWKYLGQVTAPNKGILVFPPVTRAKGVYWLSIAKGPKNIAGYVGQAGGERGFDQRFNRSTGYVKRGIKPVYLKSGELGCTSKNARRMLDALDDKQTVSVFVIDDPALADDTLRHAVEKHLIGQLCRTGVLVWNKRHVIMPSCDGNGGPEEDDTR
ncbi:MAG: hypothetical protein ABSA53_37875 [Streptosporangiaceae bacterium]